MIPINIRSKVTGSQSVKALLLAARILEQPRSTAMLFQRGCSSVAVPFTPSYSRIRLSDRMAGVSCEPLSSSPLVLTASKCIPAGQPRTSIWRREA